jgi:TP901 family phage tail tape measure protein
MPEAIQFSVGGDWSHFERQATASAQKVQRLFSTMKLNSGYERPLGKISDSAIEFEKSLKAANARVLTFGASVGVIYGVQRAFSELVKSTIDVEKALTDINVVLGTSQSKLKGFSDQLFDIARNTAQSFAITAKTATEFARQGVGMEETLKRTNDALILTRQSGLDFKDSVDTITATLNSFSKAGLDSSQIINKLANVDAAFAVSSNDLAEAIKRVGSTAEDAGISFDQLVAVVTSAQQVTARGGAVIGNAFKTIFTRLQRPEVLTQLQEMGIGVRNLSDEVLPAIDIFQELARRIDSLTSSQKSQISESVGSLYQINLLKASLSDLSNEYSIYQRALETSANATDQAITRNEELNRTLSANISRTFANLTQLGSNIGNAGINDAIGYFISNFNDALETINGSETDSIGHKLGAGIIEGIVSYVSGPGVLVFGSVVAKLAFDSFKFVKEAGKSLLALNAPLKERAILEQNIQQVLMSEVGLTDAILKGTVSQAQAERLILEVIKQQVAAKEKLAAFTDLTAARAVLGGVNPITRVKPRGAGHIPAYAVGYIPERIEKARALAAGYMPGEVRETTLSEVGKVYYNSAEKLKNFGGKTAILPPEASEAGRAYGAAFGAAHGFNPYAAGGYFGRQAGPSVATQLSVQGEAGFGGFGKMLEKKTSETARVIDEYKQTIRDSIRGGNGVSGIKKSLPFGLSEKEKEKVSREILQLQKSEFRKNFQGPQLPRQNLAEMPIAEFEKFDKELGVYKQGFRKGEFSAKEIPLVVSEMSSTFRLTNDEAKKLKKTLESANQVFKKEDFFKKNFQGPTITEAAQGQRLTQQSQLRTALATLAGNSQLNQQLINIGTGISQKGGAGDLLLNSLKTAYPAPPSPPRPPVHPSYAFYGSNNNPPGANVFPPYAPGRGAGGFAIPFLPGKSPYDIAEFNKRREALAKQSKLDEEIAKKQEAKIRREERLNKLQTPLFFASLIAPIAGETAQKFIGNETPNQRGAGAIANTLGNAVAFGGTAAAFTKNPLVGLGVGAGTLIAGLPSIVKGFTDTIPDLEKSLDKLKDSSNRSAEALAQYGTATQEIVNILSGEARNIQPGTLATLKKTQEESFARLSPERQSRLITLQNEKGLAGITEATREFQKQDETEFTGKNAEKLIQVIAQTGIRKDILGEPKILPALSGAGTVTVRPKIGQEVNPEVRADLTKILNDFLLTRDRNNKTVRDEVFSSRDAFERFQRLGENEPDRLVKALENILVKGGNITGGKVLNNLTSQFEGEDLKVLVDFLRKELLNETAFTNQERFRTENEILTRNRAQAIPRFADEIFNTGLQFSQTSNQLRQRGASQTQALNLFSQGQGELANNFIENQRPFTTQRTQQALRFRANLGAIETDRFTGIQTARQNFGQGVSDAFGSAAISSLKSQFDRFKSSGTLTNNDVQKKALEFLRPFNDTFKKIQEDLSSGNIGGARQGTQGLIENLQTQRNALLGRSLGDSRDNEDVAIQRDFFEDVITKLTESISELDGAFQLTSEEVLKRKEIEEKTNAQILDNITKQERIGFGGGIENLLSNFDALQQSTFINQGLLNESRRAGDTQTAGRAAFGLAQNQFQFTRQLPPELEKDIFNALVESMVQTGASLTTAQDNARTQIQSAFPQDNTTNLLKELETFFPKLDDNATAITSLIKRMDSPEGINVRIVSSQGSSPTNETGSAQSDDIIQKALKALPTINNDLETIKKYIGFDPKRQRPASPAETNLQGLNPLNVGGLAQGSLPPINVARGENDSVFNGRFSLQGGLRQRQSISELPAIANALTQFPLLGSDKEFTKLLSKANAELQEIKKTSKGIYDTERKVEALIARGNFNVTRQRFNEGEVSGREFGAATVAKNRTKLAATGRLGGADFGESFAASFRYNSRDLFEDLHENAIEVGETMKSSFKDAFRAFALEGKKANDALREFALGVATNIAGKALDRGVDAFIGGALSLGSAAFGSSYNRGGIVRGYSSGGLVLGGSGVRDDVPAELTAGEYVIKKSVVDKLGTSYLDKLNNNATSFNQVLKNRFDKDRLDSNPSNRLHDAANPGKFDIDSRLSFSALEDPDNPQNALRLQEEALYYQNLRARAQYDKEAEAALEQYERQIKNTMVGAYIGAAFNVAGGALGNYASTLRNVKGFNTQSPQVPARINNVAGSTQTAYVNSGGLIMPGGRVGYNLGGSALRTTSTDNIAAMLTGGEYVIRKDTVNRLGKGFFDRLNTGKVPGFANGGLVSAMGGGVIPSAGNSSNGLNDSLSKMIEVMSSVRDALVKKNDTTNTETGVTNSFIFTFNVTQAGTLEAQASVSTPENSKKDGTGITKEEAAILADRMKAVVYKVLIDEQRPGGMLPQRK